MNKQLRYHHWWAICGYSVLTLLYTWPVAAHLTTHIPGGGDAPWFLWQFWWFKYAPLTLHQLPYTTNLIYYPLQDVPVMAQTPVNETLMLPLLVGTNLTLFYNLLFLLSYVLSGYFTYLLGRALGCRPALAFVGGVLFAFCAYRGMRGLGHLSLLTTQWMPLTLLLAQQCWRRPTLHRGLALGTATALTALASPYYIGLFLLPVAGVGGLVILWYRWRQLLRPPLWSMAVGAGVMAALLVVPLYLHYLLLDVDIYTLTSALGQQAATYSADLLSWVLPSGMNPLWGQWTAPIYRHFSTANLMETTLFVGYLPLLLFGASWLMRAWSPTLRFWQLLALVALVLALGPTLHLNGAAIANGLPYHWLLSIPGFDGFRIPSRAGITTALALSVISMLVAQRLQERYRWHGRWWYGGLALFVISYLVNASPFFPYPLTDVQTPTIYSALADVDPNAALLELPAGENFSNGYNFFSQVSLWMAYQTTHHHPTVSGYLGRRPARLHEPEKRMPFVRRFFQDLPGEIAVAQPDLRQFPAPFWPDEITQAATLLDDAGIGAVALHCRAADPQEFCYAATILLTQALGLPTAVDGRHRLYKVTPPTFQITALPPYFTELAPRYDAAFTPIVYSPGRRTQTVTRSGTIEITVPLSGTWAVQGLLSGSQQAQVQLLVDGVVTMPTRDPFAADTTAWRVALPWSAGQHTVTLALPAATLTDAASSDCAQLCLHNLSIRLVQPTPAAVPAPQPLTFVNAQGETATLQQSTLLVSPPVPAPPADQATTAWLVSTWRIDDALQQKVQSAPERAPALFVHLLDAQEAVVAQVDHQLGARHLLVPAEHLLYDFTPLPPTLDPTALRVTVGLWYPDTGAYFWQPTTTATAPATSVTVGPLAPLTILLDADVFSSGQE